MCRSPQACVDCPPFKVVCGLHPPLLLIAARQGSQSPSPWRPCACRFSRYVDKRCAAPPPWRAGQQLRVGAKEESIARMMRIPPSAPRDRKVVTRANCWKSNSSVFCAIHGDRNPGIVMQSVVGSNESSLGCRRYALDFSCGRPRFSSETTEVEGKHFKRFSTARGSRGRNLPMSGRGQSRNALLT